jgi:hypothetical protein
MTDKPKASWGGKRPNQTGRPTSRAGVKRVDLHCMVDPLTLQKLRATAKQSKRSVGQVVDGFMAK